MRVGIDRMKTEERPVRERERVGVGGKVGRCFIAGV